ncbi:HIT-like domain-containing protein [Crepidotus variabilis]|uniref:HIT-like domain-containing protein n=1 Tax=Crepidotus variabilis TaxID=179855 RepID=A0A9P6EMX0_9AGAR|nr:HIT-like domain-containing protein [Crepidotus variabilis]
MMVEPNSCRFCRVSAENGFDIVYEDALFLGFTDRNPASAHHFQVIPKAHIASVRSLNPASHVGLVQAMEAVGRRILDNFGVPESMRKMGFHIPPMNSVYHLHLHVQGLPYHSTTRALKYPVVRGFGHFSKGPSWFVEVHQAMRILEHGGHIGLLPC